MGFGDIFRKEITVQLDDSERASRKDRLCEVDREVISVQAEKAGALSAFNADLKSLRDEQRKLLVAIETGIDTVEVDVLERVNERRGEVETVRCDTGEVIAELTRPMTGDERQLSLEDAATRKRKRRKATGADTATDAG